MFSGVPLQTVRVARHAPAPYPLTFIGMPTMAGAAFRAQVRDRANGGTIRADLSTTTSASAEGVRLVSNTVDGNGVRTQVIHLQFAEATMEAMPTDAADPGADSRFVIDIEITPAGGTKSVTDLAPFICAAGSTNT